MSSAPSNPVTMLLHRAAEGDSTAVRTLLPLVYDELRALAGARLALQSSGHTLQATALVHEAYLKLVSGTKGDEIGFASRAQFFAAAARWMRQMGAIRAETGWAIPALTKDGKTLVVKGVSNVVRVWEGGSSSAEDRVRRCQCSAGAAFGVSSPTWKSRMLARRIHSEPR